MRKMMRCSQCGKEVSREPNIFGGDDKEVLCSLECIEKSMRKKYPEHPHPDSVDLTFRLEEFDEDELNMVNGQRETTLEKILEEAIKEGQSPEECVETMEVVMDMNHQMHECTGVYTKARLEGKVIVVEFKKRGGSKKNDE